MNNELFEYLPSFNNRFNKMLFVIASQMNDYRVLAKKERFRLTQNEHKDIEDAIKLLDNKFILGDITFTVYKQKYIELVKDMSTSNKLKQAINGHFSCVQEYENVSRYFYSLQKKSS